MSRVGSVETARVKWFNVDKRYGFLERDRGPDLFFHFNDGMSIAAEQGRLEWSLPPEGKRLKDPVPGDLLVFEVSQGNKGPKASPWTYKQVHDRSASQASRYTPPPPPARYRVRIQYTVAGDQGKPETAWEGTDLKSHALEMAWSLKYDRSTFSCSDFDSLKWWERQEGDQWVECPDPRR